MDYNRSIPKLRKGENMKLKFSSKSKEFNQDGSVKGTKVILTNDEGAVYPLVRHLCEARRARAGREHAVYGFGRLSAQQEQPAAHGTHGVCMVFLFHDDLFRRPDSVVYCYKADRSDGYDMGSHYSRRSAGL